MSIFDPKIKCPICGCKGSLKSFADAGLLVGKDHEGYILVKCKCESILRYTPISRTVVGYIPKEEAMNLEKEEEGFNVSPDPNIFGKANPEDLIEMTETIRSWINEYSHMDIIAALTTNFCASIAAAAQEGIETIPRDQMQDFFDKVVFDSLSRPRIDFEKLGLKWNV